MGVNIIPHFSKEVPDSIPDSDIRIILDELDTLDDLATGLGLEPLGDFVHDDESSEVMDDSELEWFSIAEGLRTLRGLRKVLSSPESDYEDENGEIIVEEIEDLIASLELGEQAGAEFCFILG